MKRFIMACLVILGIGNMAMAQTKKVQLHFIETSDVHGSFFPYDFINRTPRAGTLARVSAYVKNMRREHGDNVILLDNGDILQGQPVCYYYNYIKTDVNNVAADIINYMNYDAEAIGNHDIETGHAVYDKWIREIKCPVVGANIISNETGEPYVAPYTIIERSGVRIAVIGMLTPAIPNWLKEPIWSGLHFEEMVSSATRWVDYVKKNERADVVVGLFHSGWDGGIKTEDYVEDASRAVAEQVPGFDLILFGHDHTPRHLTVTNTAGNEVLCLDPANNATRVAHATLNIVNNNGKWIVKEKIGELADVRNIPVDSVFVNHFQAEIDSVNAFVNRKIGMFKHSIYTRDSYFGNSAFNDFIQNLQLQITGADIAFNAPLGFDEKINAGDITVADMFKLYKYENQLYVMRLTGDEIRKHLEMSYDLWCNTMTSPDDHLLLLNTETKNDAQRMGFKNMSFNFDSAAGIDYEVDVTKPDGQKVRILRMSNGQPFDPKKWYRVAINSYRGNGGGELLTKGAGIPHDSLESRIMWQSELDQRYYLMKEIERQGTLDPQPNHNWRFVPEEWTVPAARRDSLLLFGKAAK